MANSPFTELALTGPGLYVDFDDWLHAVLSLVGRGTTNTPTHSFEWRRRASWNRFVTIAIKSAKPASDCVDDGDWKPPDILDRIAGIVRAELPIPRKSRPPPIEEIRPRVQQIFGDCQTISMDEFEIPYQDMLALLSATMQVDLHFSETALGYTRSLADVNEIDPSNIAKSLLNAAGIEPSKAILWNDYLAFTEQFVSCIAKEQSFGADARFQKHYRDNYSGWTFDSKVTDLWNALFHIQKVPNDHVQRPPSVILQALDYLLPSPSGVLDHAMDAPNRQARWQSRLACSVDISDTAVIKKMMAALTGELHPKLIVITGTTTESQTQPRTDHSSTDDTTSHEIGSSGSSSQATFAILTASPLWWTSSQNPEITEHYFIGNQHAIIELTPQVCALWHNEPQTRYLDLVHLSNNTLSFGKKPIEGKTTSSGLTIDLESGILTLHSRTTADDDVYIEVAIGHPPLPATPKADRQAWTSTAKIQTIEVYNLAGGVDEELEVGQGLAN